MDAAAALLKSGHLSGVGLDVVPVEPPVEPVPELIRAFRAKEPWTIGRLIITPHAAFYTPQAWDDIRSKGAETMAAALSVVSLAVFAWVAKTKLEAGSAADVDSMIEAITERPLD